MLKKTMQKKNVFCHLKVGEFIRKFNSNQFSLLNFNLCPVDQKLWLILFLGWLEMRSELGNV